MAEVTLDKLNYNKIKKNLIITWSKKKFYLWHLVNNYRDAKEKKKIRGIWP